MFMTYMSISPLLLLLFSNLYLPFKTVTNKNTAEVLTRPWEEHAPCPVRKDI